MTSVNPLDQWLSDKAHQLGKKFPILITSSVLASFGADEDIAIPLYLTAAIAGTFFSWSLISNYVSMDIWYKNCLRGLGNVGLDMIMVWVLTCAVESTIKLIFRRSRPMLRTKAALPGDIYSFPSGHTMRGFYYYIPYMMRSRFVSAAHHSIMGSINLNYTSLLPIAFTGAILTGFSRVARLRHWPSDVVMGGAIGCAFGAMFETTEQRVRFQVITISVLWAVAVALLQYLSSIRSLFKTKKPSTEWSAFVIVVLFCYWLYTHDSVQTAV